jgi:membrane protease YdiL (CAAX protease family)
MQPRATADRPPWPAWSGFAALVTAVIAGNLALVLVYGLERAAGAEVAADSPGVVIPGSMLLELILVACAVQFAALTGRPTLAQFGIRRTRFWRAVGWSALAMFIFLVAAAIYGIAVKPDEQTTLSDLGAGDSALATVAIGLLVIGFAPVCEETFFRGFLYGALRSRMSFVPAALVNGMAFGAVHAATGPQAIPPLIVLGFVFCMVYEATGSILPTIVLHALNNMVAFGVADDGSWAAGAPVAAAVVATCIVVARTRPPEPRVAPS